MMKSLKLFVLSLTFASSACSTYQVSDYGPMVRLPASRDCYEIRVLSKKEYRYPPAQCERFIERGIILTSSTWALIKRDNLVNCQLAQCKQIEGAVDGLFLAIDNALKGIPK